MTKQDMPLPSTWKGLDADLDEAVKQYGMSDSYLKTMRELGHLFFWKHFLVISRNRWAPNTTAGTVDAVIDYVRLMLRRPNAEYAPYARSAVDISEKELDLYVEMAAMKIRNGESSHVGERGVWAYAVYGLVDALATHRFERAVKE